MRESGRGGVREREIVGEWEGDSERERVCGREGDCVCERER